MKQKINEKALKYLIEKKGKKGTEINNLNIQMASYLLPNNEGVSVTDKRNIFAMRNRMTDIPANFPTKDKIENCICGKTEDMEHIYSCKSLNSETTSQPYELIFTGNIVQQILVYKRFEQNLETRGKITQSKDIPGTKPTEILNCDPLYSIECSNGYK